MSELPEHAARNREHWDEHAASYIAPARRNWAAQEASWGIWGVPESQLRMLPDDVSGLDTIELGCGTAYVSCWLARRGAKPVGIDNSEAQLATARELQAEHGLDFELIHGNAEAVSYPDASFDFAISEYGASIWCDPELWIPEASRLLRPGGRLVFLINSVQMMLCSPESDLDPLSTELERPQFGMKRFEWPDDDSVEFHLPHGELIALMRRNGFEVEELIEVQPPEGSTTSYEWARLDWARKWPTEEVWKVRKA
jgi:SAM-dependent methyltransferase